MACDGKSEIVENMKDYFLMSVIVVQKPENFGSNIYNDISYNDTIF